MNNISAGANLTPHSYISNASQAGGLGAQLKGLQRTGDDEAEAHAHKEEAQLSRLAQQSIEESQAQQEGRGAENARQSGADSEIMDDLHQDGGEENEVHERHRQHELGKTRDGSEVIPGQGAQTHQQGNGVVHEEAGVELSEIGRSPEEVLSDVPGHSAAFAKGSVEAQLANPAQVGKLTEIKPLPDQQRIEADSPELQPVNSLGPVLGDKESGEVSQPSPQTEGRAPTTVPQEYDPEQMAHMEQVVAEQQLARQNSGDEEMLIAGGLPGGSGVGQQTQAMDDPNARKAELNTNFLTARNELIQSTGDLEQYGWGAMCGQLLQKHGGNEGAAAYELRGMMHGVLTKDPGLAQIWQESSQNPDGLKSFVDRSRQYIADNAHKHDAADVDAAQKMVTCFDKCNNFLDAGTACIRETGSVPSPQQLEQLSGKLFDSVGRTSANFQSEFKGEMGKLAEAGKLNEGNMSQTAGAVSSNLAARRLNEFDTKSLFSPPGQSDEEADEVAARAQARKQQWIQEEVDGDTTDAMAFEQSSWAAQKMQTQPSPELAAYQAKLGDYIAMNTVMRQGYGLMTNNPDYYERSAYAQR